MKPFAILVMLSCLLTLDGEADRSLQIVDSIVARFWFGSLRKIQLCIIKTSRNTEVPVISRSAEIER